MITPNIPEAQVLAQMPIGNQADMETAAVQLAKDYGTCVLVKGGHGVKDADDAVSYTHLDVYKRQVSRFSRTCWA